MKFLERIINLHSTYTDEECGIQDNAQLYGVCNPTPPLATHVVFRPMTQDIMQDLINNYKRRFPKALLEIYQVMNGADLFWKVRFVGKKKIPIPLCSFSIYGVPLTYDRMHIEPYNICIEDLDRPNGTPDNWLKFGSYYRPGNESDRIDLYVDTDCDSVFAVKHGSTDCCILSSWDSIDSCLCCIFDLLQSQVKAV